MYISMCFAVIYIFFFYSLSFVRFAFLLHYYNRVEETSAYNENEHKNIALCKRYGNENTKKKYQNDK